MIYYKIVSRTKFILIGFVFVNPDVSAHGRIFMYRSIFFQVHLEVILKESLEEKKSPGNLLTLISPDSWCGKGGYADIIINRMQFI